jgi:ABC-type Fe3+ transport system permease subunit
VSGSLLADYGSSFTRTLASYQALFQQTVQLLVIAYIAASLPTSARVLVGSVSQLQPSLRDAASARGRPGRRLGARRAPGAVPASADLLALHVLRRLP